MNDLPTMSELDESQVKTIEYYNTHADQYSLQSLSFDLSDIYKRFLAFIPDMGHILDAGSGSGRDTHYFEQHGYEVTAFDASSKMVELSSKRTGTTALNLSFEEICFENKFDGIWASASLLHVPKSKLNYVLEKLTKALKPLGILYVSFKYGEGELFENERFFNNYTEDSFLQVLNSHPLLHIKHIWRKHDDSRENLSWLNVLLQKSS